MKEIPLTQGQVAIVDDEDYDELSKHKWNAHWDPKLRSFYAVRSITCDKGKQRDIRMHRVIMGAQPGQQVDHIHHNTLDNRHSELRICTYSQNQQNRKKQTGRSSIYKGVAWFKRYGKWQVRININGRRQFLGYFVSEVDAAHAYDTKARELFGEFARRNCDT